MDELRDKTLIMVVGPSATGKSTIMNQTVRTDSRFRRVKSFTTRPPRDNDEPDQYHYLRANQLRDLAAENKIVSQVTFPTTGQTYGTLTSSYTGRYCLLDTLSNSVEDYRQLSFESCVVISLTTTADLWHQRFLSRYPTASSEAIKRLEEAKLSINWSLSQATEHLWLVNDGSIEQVAKKLIDLSTGASVSSDDGAPHAYAMLELIKGGNIWPVK